MQAQSQLRLIDTLHHTIFIKKVNKALFLVIICVDKFQIVFAAQMEVTMNKKRKNLTEKNFSIVASLAIVIALVAGIISIVRSNTRQDKKRIILI